ncbi:helix-turn-helix domain containing protein [Roseomonas xinghualingensis]|uniref:helix-turn-helix domain containing protein n=1 Tax=Roseomonas xinghualingensis TaxID=2986475 RepID=UPI0021F0F9CB|nr:helix-turn-helix domain containing protein [Roseomonas sp. SXEYE001]MCV4208576.1 helix-turn-helix domain containing protein [Roseomonas sp. SXEYE001]
MSEIQPADIEVPSGLTEAIRLAGSKAELARRLRVVKSAIGNWERSGRVPAEQAARIEAIYRIPVRDTCPHLYEGAA